MKQLVVIIFALFLTSCSRQLFLNIEDINNYQYPKFCVSTSEYCVGGTTSLPFIWVHELSEDDGFFEGSQNIVWSIHSRTNVERKYFTYGVTPDGWVEETKPRPLKLNTLYAFDNGEYLIMWRKGQKIEHKIFRLNKTGAISFLNSLEKA